MKPRAYADSSTYSRYQRKNATVIGKMKLRSLWRSRWKSSDFWTFWYLSVEDSDGTSVVTGIHHLRWGRADFRATYEALRPGDGRRSAPAPSGGLTAPSRSAVPAPVVDQGLLRSIERDRFDHPFDQQRPAARPGALQPAAGPGAEVRRHRAVVRRRPFAGREQPARRRHQSGEPVSELPVLRAERCHREPARFLDRRPEIALLVDQTEHPAG